jgi:hypothetical protein
MPLLLPPLLLLPLLPLFHIYRNWRIDRILLTSSDQTHPIPDEGNEDHDLLQSTICGFPRLEVSWKRYLANGFSVDKGKKDNRDVAWFDLCTVQGNV